MIGERRHAVPLARDGALVSTLDPATGRPLPEGGSPVVVTVYWYRRARDGDVELRPITPPVEPASSASTTTPETPKKRRKDDGE